MYRSLLFVCALNSCRSIIGQAVFDYIKDQTQLAFEVSSAGIWANDGHSCDPQIQAIGARRGYDLSTYSSTALQTLAAKDYSNIYIFEQAHFEPLRLWMGGQRAPEFIMDYSQYFGSQEVLMQEQGNIESCYTHIFDLIEDGCLGLYKQLSEEKENNDI